MHLPYAFVTQIEDIVFIFNTMLERKRELVMNFHKKIHQMMMINTNYRSFLHSTDINMILQSRCFLLMTSRIINYHKGFVMKITFIQIFVMRFLYIS